VVVDNRPGANTFIGMNACAKAPPDGSTICMTVAESMTHNPFLFTSDAHPGWMPAAVIVALHG
jgi:tripartite-type tricarboxylate transporter receptor subunit TctC